MNAVLKYPGSKWSTADWIISHFPADYEQMTYLEPFFGSGAVFFNKNRSTIETINDLDSSIFNFFKVVRDSPEELAKRIELTPWSREEYRESYKEYSDPIEKARTFMVRLWQAIGGKTSDITGWSNNIKPSDSGKSRWCRLTDDILKQSERLKSKGMNVVQVENMDAVELIKRYNYPYVLIYCDPPYLLETRSKRIYANELSDNGHVELLRALKEHKGKVIISGYESDLYDEYLVGWHKECKSAHCEMGKKSKEVLWMNFEPYQQMRMF